MVGLNATLDPLRSFVQQSGIIGPKLLSDPSYTIVGCGAIGSFFAVTLAKMGGDKFTLMDSDRIEEHNISNQMYPYSSVGKLKRNALGKIISNFRSQDMLLLNSGGNFLTGEVFDSHVVVAAVDSMDVRKEVWKSVKKSKGVNLFLDGRMGAEFMRVYAINPRDLKQVELYDSTLYSSQSAVQERCTAKTIIYTVLMVSGIMLDLLKKSLNGEKRPWEVCFDTKNFILVKSEEV